MLSWVTYAPYRGPGSASRAVRLLVDWAFAELGLRRVEAEVDPLNRASLRTALRAGLRREGLLRGNTTLGGEVHDTVVLGRLSMTPRPAPREGFTAMLDSVLPTKRVIGQGLIRDGAGASCCASRSTSATGTCPAASSTPASRPATCVAREIREELALEVTVGRLLATNWLAPWLGWGDALLFVYEVGAPSPEALSRVRLLEREIRAVHWVATDECPAGSRPTTSGCSRAWRRGAARHARARRRTTRP